MRETLRELVGEGLLQNAMALWTVQFFRKTIPLITIPYLARVLGPEGWGLVAIFQSLAACLALLMEFGFELSATRQVASASPKPRMPSADAISRIPLVGNVGSDAISWIGDLPSGR